MVMKKRTLVDKLEAVLDDNVNHPAHYTYGSSAYGYFGRKGLPWEK